ncbi:hypothetical protein [Bradyrhizobium phage BDU-MI-1]|nr:hypothetical protein [Bradyrhizobium phage BDU-MI-1]
MSTNFYVKEAHCCPTCGKQSEVHHIGKSSGGWRFLFRGYREFGLTSANAWLQYLLDRTIVDEYGVVWSWPEFTALIRTKQDGRIAHNDKKEVDPEGYPVAYYEFS